MTELHPDVEVRRAQALRRFALTKLVFDPLDAILARLKVEDLDEVSKSRIAPMTLDEASEIFRLEPVGTVGSRAQLCAAIVVSLSLGNGLKIELECAAKVMHLDLGDLDAVGRKLVGLGDG